jgi:UDP-N-acetylmuramate dehydrogenase
MLGAGCNVLVADSGVRGLTIVNRADGLQYLGVSGAASVEADADGVRDRGVIRAEAGAMLSAVARDAVARGMAGLEWASGLPGTVGGAVVGNAGAFEGDVAHSLCSAAVLEPDGDESEHPVEWFQFEYRASRLKRNGGEGHVLLSADFAVCAADPVAVAEAAERNLAWRRTRHPSGATMGSTFKNPPGSHAGYLIEQAGLRGHRIGGAEISALHGNFIMNAGGATASDVFALIEYARSVVGRSFGVELELEIELIGW